MRIIQTTAINDALNQDQPLLGASIDFLTQNQIETLNSIVQNLIGPSYSSSQVYVLWGCVVTGVTSGFGNFAMTAGAVFFNGEIFQIAAVTTVAVGLGIAVYSTIASNPTTTDPYTGTRALDPITMSDGVTTINAHLTRTWVTSVAVSGPNPVNGWIYINQPPIPLIVGGTGVAYHSGYSQYNQLSYWKDNLGSVHIQGDFTSGGTDSTGILFTLPTGMRPARNVYGILTTDGGSNYSSYKANTAYGLYINTSGQVIVNFGNPATTLDAGNYRVVITSFSLL